MAPQDADPESRDPWFLNLNPDAKRRIPIGHAILRRQEPIMESVLLISLFSGFTKRIASFLLVETHR